MNSIEFNSNFISFFEKNINISLSLVTKNKVTYNQNRVNWENIIVEPWGNKCVTKKIDWSDIDDIALHKISKNGGTH